MFKCLSVSLLGIRCTLSEQVELALLAHFRHMDLDMLEVAALVAENGIEYGQSVFRSAGMGLGSWTLPDGWRHDESQYQKEQERLPRLAELSQQLGCHRAITTIEPASDEIPFHENFEWHRGRLAPLADILKLHGVRLGLEFVGPQTARDGRQHEFIHDLDAAVQLAEAMGSDNVGIVLDAFHWYTSGGRLEQIQQLRPEQIVAVQISDAPAHVPTDQQKDRVRALPGKTGVIDLIGFLQTLAEIGYQGPVTPEPYDRDLRGHSRDHIVLTTGEWTDKLWEQAGLPQAAEVAVR